MPGRRLATAVLAFLLSAVVVDAEKTVEMADGLIRVTVQWRDSLSGRSGIGYSYSKGYGWHGYIDEMAIYSAHKEGQQAKVNAEGHLRFVEIRTAG